MNHVLNKLHAFFKCGNLSGLFIVVFTPCAVFGFTFFSTVINSLNGFIIIVVGLSQVNVSLFKNFIVVMNSISQRCYCFSLFQDLFAETTNCLFTNGIISAVLFVSTVLSLF